MTDNELNADERAELERLRAEVARLRQPPAKRWRSIVASLLITLGCLLAPPAGVAVWAANVVTDTDRYVETMTPVAASPAVQDAVVNRATVEIMSRLDVPAIVTRAVDALEARGLPPRIGDRLEGLATPLTSGVEGFIRKQASALVRSEGFQTAWVNANRVAHKQLNAVLSGEGSEVLKVQGDTVNLDLGYFIAQLKQRLVSSGMGIAANIPELHPTIQLIDSSALIKAQDAYQLLNTLKWLLPVLSLILLALGVYVAKSHRRALIGVGLGVALAMLLLAVGLTIGRSVYLSWLSEHGLSVAAGGDIFDILIRYLKIGMRTLLVLGLVVAGGAFFTGPSVTAVQTRSAVSRGIGALRAGGESIGVRTGRLGTWIHLHRTALRIAVVVLAAVVFVFWERPTGAVVLLLTLLVLLALAIIEFLGRPPPPRLNAHA